MSALTALRKEEYFFHSMPTQATGKIEMDENDTDKTAFVLYYVLYSYTRMPFGVKNALATF